MCNSQLQFSDMFTPLLRPTTHGWLATYSTCYHLMHVAKSQGINVVQLTPVIVQAKAIRLSIFYWSNKFEQLDTRKWKQCTVLLCRLLVYWPCCIWWECFWQAWQIWCISKKWLTCSRGSHAISCSRQLAVPYRSFHPHTGKLHCAQFSLAQLLITVLKVCLESTCTIDEQITICRCRTLTFFGCTASLDDGHLTENLQH